MSTPLSNAVTEAAVDQMAGKPFYMSKTFWANVIAAVAMAVQTKYGFVIGPEFQTLGLAVINMALRSVTKEKIIW